MAVEKLVRTTCDRCKNVIEELHNASAGDDRGGKPVLYLEHKSAPALKFEDLCQKCSERVENLIGQIKLEKEEKKPAKKAKKPADKKEPPKSPAGDEGDEGFDDE